MTDALIGLGSNLGDRQANLARAVALLRAAPGVDDVVASRPLQTSPIGGPAGQGEFLNAAARVSTTLAPLALLDVLHGIESQLGRQREVHWGPRTIDLDLLLYGDELVDSPRLQLPHPRLPTRKFVLVPASEVASDMRHPAIGWTIGKLLDHLLQAPPYFAVTGTDHAANTRIATAAAHALGVRVVLRPSSGVAASPSERLQFLTQAAQRLPTSDEAQRERAIISDFWIGEAFPASRSELAHACARLPRQVVEPKLLAVADAQSEHGSCEGPVLRLPEEQTAAASALVAAIESMQS